MECGEDVTGVCLPFTFPSRKPERGSFYIDSRRPSVVYRRCFGRQWDMGGDFMRNQSVPAAFKDVFARKVSDNYFDSNLELPVEGMDGNYVYVGLFSAYGWRGIDFTKVESGKALFRNLASRQVYILLAFANGQYRPIGNPFILMARIYILMLQIPPSAILLNCIGNTLFRNVSGTIWEG